jgi:KDO2-lipid IV(A) lauroyltransferase
MILNVPALAANPRSVRLGIGLIRVLPIGASLHLADWLAVQAAQQSDSAVVQAVRLNQSVIRGLDLNDPILDQAITEVMQNAARGYVYLIKNFQQGPEKISAGVSIDPDLLEVGRRVIQQENRGLFVIASHSAGFDQAMLALGQLNLPVQGLSYADPTGVYQIQNEIRAKSGVLLTPITAQSLRQAMRNLKQSQIIMTAVDRPDEDGEPLEFFGRPAHLPIGHARLAVRTQVPILVVGVQKETEGHYRAKSLGLFEPHFTDNEQNDAVQLAQQVIGCLEKHIRQRPGEWLMFFPVWQKSE